MSTIATKDQEREALAKIKKIVTDLGENSYIGTAFEGAFDTAEQNIEYDAAFSLKGEADLARQEAEELKGQVKTHLAEIDRLKEEIDSRVDELDATRRKLTDAQLTAGAIEDTHDQTAARLAAAEEDARRARLEVTQLKAKLYDFMVAKD